MPVINLSNCFPVGKDGIRSPLPKQADFMRSVLDPKGPKYIAYVGGVGSGKTLIGCITMLSLAVLYPGDYLISRQYMPELKITTLKTFKEICPPELIEEERVADGILRIKSSNGKVSNIIFRPLEEPDKLRSLNLSGAYIDEANQVSEAAFMLLQGRLRGNGLRKLFLTTNPKGHDWIFSWFVKQDHLKTKEAKTMFKLVKAPTTENIHLPDGYVQSMLDSWSPERVQREIMGSFDSFEGQVFPEFRRDVHVIKPFVIPKDWVRIIGADHGFRNPSAWIWVAQDGDDNLYVYREFYERELLIQDIAKRAYALTKGEAIQQFRIDPSTRAARANNGESDWDTYRKFLPDDFPMMPANNSKETGIDRIKTYLKVDPRTHKPKLFVFDTCENLIDEIVKYRYQELTPNQEGRTNVKEEPVKVHDHALDALRYAVMAFPEPEVAASDKYKHVRHGTLERALVEEIENMKNPKNYKDDFGDY